MAGHGEGGPHRDGALSVYGGCALAIFELNRRLSSRVDEKLNPDNGDLHRSFLRAAETDLQSLPPGASASFLSALGWQLSRARRAAASQSRWSANCWDTSITSSSDTYAHLKIEDTRRALVAAGWLTDKDVQR